MVVCSLLALISGPIVFPPSMATLRVPTVEQGTPAAGSRVLVTPAEYRGTTVRHSLYLPNDWQPASKNSPRWPVIVELTGNKYAAAGSTGKVEDAGLGYGLSGGRFVWVVLPFVSDSGQAHTTRWWGDVEATVAYAKRNVPRICNDFGGDTGQVFLCGFSRGAIGVNLIGLHDNEIASLWAGLITHDHYDGERAWRGTSWGEPLSAYREAASQRLKRLNGRPVLICQNGPTDSIRAFLEPRTVLDAFTFLTVDTTRILGEFPNDVAVHPHTDRWLLKPSPERDRVWRWFAGVIGNRSTP